MSNRKGEELNRETFFTAEEGEKLIQNFLQSRGHAGATEEEIEQLCTRLIEMKLEGLLVQLAIEDKVDLHWSPEKQKVLFSASSPATMIH